MFRLEHADIASSTPVDFAFRAASGSTMAEKTARDSVVEVMVNGEVHVIDDTTAREHRMDGSLTLVKSCKSARAERD